MTLRCLTLIIPQDHRVGRSWITVNLYHCLLELISREELGVVGAEIFGNLA